MKYSKNLVWLLLTIFLPLSFSACSEDAKEDFSNVPGVENESWGTAIVCKPEGETMNYTFKALSAWKISEDNDWIVVSPTTGKKGSSQIKVTVNKNESEVTRTGTITIVVEGYKSVSLSLKQDAVIPPVVKGDTEMNPRVDAMLEKYYLWNDEYKKLTRNLDIPFVDSYENFLRTTLMNMTTNTLDKKRVEGTTDYTIYSYIDRTPKSGRSTDVPASAKVNHGVKKGAKIDTYGLSRLIGLSFVDTAGKPTGEYGFAVRAIYPGSSAEEQNLTRGTIIYEIDGKAITSINYASYYLSLLSPNKNSVKLLVGKVGESAKEVTLQMTQVDPSPILKTKVIENSGRKIGYFMYDAFDAAYDDEVLEVFADFKSQGVTDLVMDLRYNGGGHVISSMMLSACVAGSKCKNQIFQYYRYNSDRMANVENTKKETGNGYDENAKYFFTNYFYDNYYSVNLGSYALGFDNVYVLATSSTASSSEVFISSLRGLGLNVALIGEEHTNGKNVGMEVDQFEMGDYSYELAPITFQYYNSKKETVPETGIKVDYNVVDWNNGYVDFGELNEPMLAKAIELITGNPSSSRSAVPAQPVFAKTLPLPDVNHRSSGVIVFRDKAEQ